MTKIALVVLALIASGCVSGVATPEAVATNTAISSLPVPVVATGSVTASATATANPTRSASLTPSEKCRQVTDDLLLGSPFQVELSPPAPRGGERVTVTGRGLPPGTYSWRFGLPNTDAVFFGRERFVVAQDGQLSGSVNIPARPDDGETCYVLFVGEHPAAYFAPPFVAKGNAVLPGRCESIPESVRDDLIPLKMSPTNPSAGEIVTVQGDLPPQRPEWFQPGSFIYVDFGTTGQWVEIALAKDSISQTGQLRFTFVPPSRPDWTGLCVQMNVRDGPTGNVGYVRFYYP